MYERCAGLDAQKGHHRMPYRAGPGRPPLRLVATECNPGSESLFGGAV